MLTITSNPVFPLFSKPQNPNFIQNLNSKNLNFTSYSQQIDDNYNAASDKPVLINDWPQILKTSINTGNFKLGLSVHGFLAKLGFQHDVFMGNNLINMYAKFNSLDYALKVFEEMLERNTITWTTLINGYAQENDVKSVFEISSCMNRMQVEFNAHTWSVILGACELSSDRICGEQIHCSVIKSGFWENLVVQTSLMSMYSRSGYLKGVETLFKNMIYADIRCLNFMILEYARAGNIEKAIEVFLDLINSGLEPSDYTLTNILSTCNGERDLKEDKQLHGLAVKHDHLHKPSVGNAIIVMYGNHGLIEDAENMFVEMSVKNLVTWTAFFSACVKNGEYDKELKGFTEMISSGIFPDSNCVATVLDGCSERKNPEFGSQIHGIVIKKGLLFDVNVVTALVDMYAKCRKLRYARKILKNLNCTVNISCFNALLAGFSEEREDQEEDEDAMVLFNELRAKAGVRPDSVTFARLISLSAYDTSLIRGQSLHAFSIKTGFIADSSVANAVITMYAKCGNVQDSHQAFCSTKHYDTVTWNAIISAYAINGKGKKAVMFFQEMIKERFIPDGITILGVLQACIYSQQWKYGFEIFNSMESRFGIKPVIEHFCCMVDLLGRAGFLSETVTFIKKSPFFDSPLLWRTLVNVCKLCGDLNFGKLASNHLLDLEPKETGSYILVSNMFEEMGMFDESSTVKTLMDDLNVRKEAGFSSIVVDNTTHRFLASSKNHPESRRIYTTLDG